MKQIVTLAWRNIWRNKRRTLITIGSVFFAILLALVMRSMQLGSYGYMIDSVVHSYTGHIQVHAKGYWDDKTLDNSFAASDSLVHAIASVPGITLVVPRLESFALASFRSKTKGVMVVGIDPPLENKLTNLSHHIVKGSWLTPSDNGVALGQTLANYLDVNVGDTLVLMSVGYQGMSAANLFPVRAILKLPAPEMDNSFVFITLSQAQSFYSAQGRLTSYAMLIDKNSNLEEVTSALREKLGPDQFEVMTWKELMVQLMQQIQADNVSGLFMLAILYMVVGFGIFGTLLMMISERRRELAVMVAVGMKKGKLALVIACEVLFITLIGLMSGIAGAMPIILYYHHHPIWLTGQTADAMLKMGFDPIMPFALQGGFFVAQSMVIFVIAMVAALYPVISIFRIIPSKDLRR
ncbi:MAG TPA: ABC transporter permease [Williamwhitmania sp.]|nr:ABC transporter permease [Williamwhitmania sp.]